MHHSPLPEPGPRIASTFQRYIYTHDDVVRLLEAAAQPVHPATLIQPPTLRLLVLVVYATGLRAGEALRLRGCDVDLRDRLLTVWDSKFFKSRLVPIGTALCRALAQYHTDRVRLPRAAGERSVFFATRRGGAISIGRLEHAFTRLLQQTHVGHGFPGHRPRPHDLRATFAVHRLIAWYREGVDVQARLPALATYLGHVNVSATSVYLTMTPELLVEASRRFERYAQPARRSRRRPMPEHHLLGPYIRRFLLEHVVGDRNLSRQTQRSYRDAIRVLLRFMTERHRIDSATLTVEQVTADVVREFLQYLEQERTAATLNQRVSVIHALFRFIGRHVPELVERASQIQAVPLRRVDHPAVPYLAKSRNRRVARDARPSATPGPA